MTKKPIQKLARVVKIKALQYLLMTLVLLVVFAGAASAQSKLLITDVEVEVDGEDDSIDVSQDGDRVSEEAKPGSKVEIKVEVENNFTDTDDLDIEDIEIRVTIEGIDDGDDLDEEADEFDLRAERDDSETLEFDIPIEVGEGDYDVLIEVEGEDENGTEHTAELTFILEVEKERHEIRFTRLSLSPEQVQCSRNTQFSVNLINTGQEDEEDIELRITNTQLGIDETDTFDLDEGEFDDDMKYSRSFSFTVDEDVAAGTYPIEARVTYDDGGETETERVSLLVQECEEEEEEPAQTPSDGQNGNGAADDDSTQVVIEQPSTPTTGGAGGSGQDTSADIIQPPTTASGGQSGSLLDSPLFIVSIIVLEVLIVIGGVALVIHLLRR